MIRKLTPRGLAPVAAVGFIVAIGSMAVIGSAGGEEAVNVAPTGGEVANPNAFELTRCRTVTLDQTARLANCRRVWAEHRRQFFRPIKAPPASAEADPTATISFKEIRDRISPLGVEHQQSEDK
jgi:conjugative transfer region protein TrbK